MVLLISMRGANALLLKNNNVLLNLSFLIFLFVTIYYLGNLRAAKPNKPFVHAVISNEVVIFPDNESGLPLLMEGFSSQENWGIWSNGEQASLNLFFMAKERVDVKLCFHPFLEESFEGAVLEVSSEKYDLMTLPRCTLIENCGLPLNIDFKDLNAVTPKSTGMNDDQRRIALGLTLITINKSKNNMSEMKCTVWKKHVI